MPLEVPTVLIDESPGVAPPAHQVTEAIKPVQQTAVQVVRTVAPPLAPVVTDVVTRVNVVLDSVEDAIPALSLSPSLSAKG